MLHLSTILKHYKRQDVQEAMIAAAEDREVAVKFGENGFGKRPETLTYPNDILEFAKKGATSFHVSEERWNNVMQLSTELRKQELEALRKGWDLVIDIDCKLWNYSKHITQFIIDELQKHGISSISAKFSGNKGFHVGIPFEAFPKEMQGQKTVQCFPDGPRRIALYLAEKIKPRVLEYVQQHDSFSSIAEQLGINQTDLYKTRCKSCKKIQKKEEEKIEFRCLYCDRSEAGTKTEEYRICQQCTKIMEKKELKENTQCPYCKNTKFTEELDLSLLLQIDTVLISSRHLYRMPYSLHEKSGLCSVPCDPLKVKDFDKEAAKPENVKVEWKFLEVKREQEATKLIVEAFDFQPTYKEEKEERTKKFEEETLQAAIPSEFFPPCMKLGLQGMQDGKKRFLFIAVNFLLSVGYDYAAIDSVLEEWNKKNPEPLREVILKGQLRYAEQTRKKILPPNCDTPGYYVDLQICKPDGLCGRIKNPVQYAKRRAFLAQREYTQMQSKGKREHLTEEQKEMRKKFREKGKEESPKQ